jgi:hypothetical protein
MEHYQDDEDDIVQELRNVDKLTQSSQSSFRMNNSNPAVLSKELSSSSGFSSPSIPDPPPPPRGKIRKKESREF